MRVLSVVMRTGSDSTLDRVVGLLRRRCFPVSSICFNSRAGEQTEIIHVTIPVQDACQISLALTQLRQLPDVLAVAETGAAEALELARIAVTVSASERSHLLDIARAFNACLTEEAPDRAVLETVQSPEQVNLLLDQIRAVGPAVVSRTGAICEPLALPAAGIAPARRSISK